MKSSLIPEKPLLVTPSLAATIGLEEAVLLSVLGDLAPAATVRHNNGFDWINLPVDAIRELTPFWDDREVQRVCQSLRDKGVLLIGPAAFGSDNHFRFAYNERVKVSRAAPQPERAHTAPEPRPTRGRADIQPAAQTDDPGDPFGKNRIGGQWRPSEDTLAQLAQHAIPRHFALEQLPEFIAYWRERGEAHRAWGAKFLQHVIFKWRDHEARVQSRDLASPMTASWRPSDDAMDVLTRHAGISPGFVEDAIPEFILYWQERGDVLKTWNSKFIQHVRLQWKKYNSTLEHSTDPKPIPDNWQPSEDVYDVLRLANIDLAFARELLPEFVLYWRDNGKAHTSWNTRFLQHVKHHWARRLAQGPADPGQRSTREISIEEQLNDRSWAS